MSNPLLSLDFDVPFDRIAAEHVEPAMTTLVADATAKLEGIEANTGERTYENTLHALERSTERLEVAMTVVGHLEAVASTPALRAAYNAVRPTVGAFFASISLRPKLWDALKAYAKTDGAARLEGPRGAS